MALEKGPIWSEAIESLVNTLGAKLLMLMQSTSVNLFHEKKRKTAHKQSSTALSEFIQKERALAATTDLSEALDSSTNMPEGALNSLVGKVARKAVSLESTQRHSKKDQTSQKQSRAL
jgi:hypothetical protein